MQNKNQNAISSKWLNLFSSREAGVFLALVLLIVTMSGLNPYFLTPLNIFNVLRSMATIAIMAIGMTMIIVTAGIDLSVGSVLAASSMLTARLIHFTSINPWIAVIIGIAFGFTLGLINGILITKVKIAPFIATLGMLSIARGLTYMIASGLEGTVASNIPMRNEAVNFMGGGYIGPVPFPVILMIVLVVFFSLFLKHTVLGRHIYAVGSNEQAARLSGVDLTKVKLFVYSLTGALSGFAGILNAGLLATAATNAGVGNELDVIAAVAIGGASLAGGQGTIYGAVIGAAIMAILRNAFVLLKLPVYMQTVAIGVVIILAVASDTLKNRRTTRRQSK